MAQAAGARLPAGDGPRVLLTGGGGFVGRRLAALLADEEPGWRVDVPAGPMDAAGPEGRLDVTDAPGTAAFVEAHRPDMVVHLAAVAAVTAAVSDPRTAWEVNLGGALNVVLALQRHAPAAHLMLVSSAEVYGASLADACPADEGTPLQPVNPYAASKAAADLLVRQAAYEGLSASVMRPFNHTGAGQSEAFVVPSFAAQIARIEAGLRPPVLEVGGLDEERDFLDVDDVARAYLAVLSRRGERGAGEVFNVASARPVRIGHVLEVLQGLSPARMEVRVEPGRLRRTVLPKVAGDASRLRAATGWAPRIPLEETLAAVLAHERARVAAVR